MKNQDFRIAEQIVRLSMPDGEEWEKLLPSFVPFRCVCPADEKVMCSLEVVTDELQGGVSAATFLTDIERERGERFRMSRSGDLYILEMERCEGIMGRSGCYRMVSNLFFTKGYAYIGSDGNRSGEVLNTFLMMQFAQSAVFHHTCLIHASAVMKSGFGYAFLGKSGTGKSTHSALWIKSFTDVELLNDDNPAVRITDNDRVYIYGTPWSGKTPCYKNTGVELVACVRLEQSPVNRFFPKSGAEAFIILLPSCSSMRWSERLYASLCDLLEKLVRCVPVGLLQCKPDQEAAYLCYDKLIENKIEKR